MKKRFFFPTLILCSLFVTASPTLGTNGSIMGCWDFSPPDPPTCGALEVCVEWEENGWTVATDCCASGELDLLGCNGSCNYLERPVLTAPAPTAEPIGTEVFNKSIGRPSATEANLLKPIRPHINILFEGVEYRPENIDLLDDLTLHFLFILDDRGTGQRALYAFTSMGDLLLELRNRNQDRANEYNKLSINNVTSGALLFASEHWQGPFYFLPTGLPVNFHKTWWDGKVSSLKGSGTPSWITFFTDANRSGSSLTLSTAWDRPTLEPFGWDGRAASVYLWPRNQILPID